MSGVGVSAGGPGDVQEQGGNPRGYLEVNVRFPPKKK